MPNRSSLPSSLNVQSSLCRADVVTFRDVVSAVRVMACESQTFGESIVASMPTAERIRPQTPSHAAILVRCLCSDGTDDRNDRIRIREVTSGSSEEKRDRAR